MSEQAQEVSIKLVAGLRGLRDQVDAAIEEVKATLWLPREYSVVFSNYQGRYADGNNLTPAPREDALLLPGEDAFLAFGADFVKPGTEQFGIPETIEHDFGIERICQLKRLSIHDEDAPHFVIKGFSVGQYLLLGTKVVPASYFAASAPEIKLDRYADRGLAVSLTVRNVTQEPRAFRATLHVLEQPAV